ncbi:MAG: succinate--CoA ligase subunit alpha [Anaerolineae bacterium]
MAILVDEQSRIIIQGITGREGSYYARQMLLDGTRVLGGVTPGKGGEWIESKPVFDTVKAALNATEANVSLVCVPAAYATDAIYEAVDAGIPLVICITNGVPIQDVMKVREYARSSKTCLLGPNCAGVISPGLANVGMIPAAVASPGSVGIVSKSGTLLYAVMHEFTRLGLGQSTCVSIGSDPIVGTSFRDVLELFEHDVNTEKIVLLGEIGGHAEVDAAEYIKRMTKPVVSYITGSSAPENQVMGHRGAIIENGRGDASEKIAAMLKAGAKVADSLEEVPFLFP